MSSNDQRWVTRAFRPQVLAENGPIAFLSTDHESGHSRRFAAVGWLEQDHERRTVEAGWELDNEIASRVVLGFVCDGQDMVLTADDLLDLVDRTDPVTDSQLHYLGRFGERR